MKASADEQVATDNVYGFQNWQVALMGQVTGDSTYCTYAVEKTESFVQSEEAKIAAFDPNDLEHTQVTVAYDSYHDVGDIIGSMSMVYDWCRSSMTDAQRARWRDYGNATLFNLWNADQAHWGSQPAHWSSWGTDDPGNNYYYYFLRATMTFGLATYGENSMADDWINQFRINKVQNQLVPILTAQTPDGGSREGPAAYGVSQADLFSLYHIWEDSTGERIADLTPHTLASMPWMAHSITPTLDQVIPIGDLPRDETAHLYDYHRAYLLELMSLYPNERVAGVVKTLLGQSSVPVMTQQSNRSSDYLNNVAWTSITARPLSELSTAYWGSGTGLFSMRNDWTTTSAYANFMCGALTQSHAHQDQGGFLLFKGGWFAFDGVMQSHSGLRPEQKYHNTVRFEDSSGTAIEQQWDHSCNMGALANTSNWTYASADITPMYGGGAGPIAKSQREFLFIKPATFIVYDRAQTSDASVKRIFTMNFPMAPMISGNSMSLVIGANRFDMTRIAPTAGTYTSTLLKNDPPVDYPDDYDATTTAARIDLTESGGSGKSEFLHVIGLDGSVSSAVAINASGQTGTTVTLADGRTVKILFNQDSPGGTYEIRSSGGSVIESGTLPTSIQAPPIYAN